MKILEALRRAISGPIKMILHCPNCGSQHIDAPDPLNGWLNPPHRSHKCAVCKWVWRPADVETEGVAHIETMGSVDSVDYRESLGTALNRIHAEKNRLE